MAPSQGNFDGEFDRIVQRHQQRVYNVIYRLIDDPEEALDLTQDTFVAAYRAFGEFRGDSGVYTWLYRIAVNRTKNRLKQLGRLQAAEAFSLDEPMQVDGEKLGREVEDYTNAPDRILEGGELLHVIERSVAALPHDFREAVILRDYQGLSYREIADIVGCSEKAIKSRLHRARTILRERLQTYLMPQD